MTAAANDAGFSVPFDAAPAEDINAAAEALVRAGDAFARLTRPTDPRKGQLSTAISLPIQSALRAAQDYLGADEEDLLLGLSLTAGWLVIGYDDGQRLALAGWFARRMVAAAAASAAVLGDAAEAGQS